MLIAFKLLQIVILLAFIFFISDFRKKNQNIPIIKVNLILVLRIIYIFPIGSYSVVFFTLDTILISDIIALFVNLFGMLLVAKAKIDLGPNHTWTGYCKENTNIVKTGSYSYIRHPLYLGIFIYSMGALFTIIPHSPYYITAGFISFIIMLFLLLSLIAKRETEFLSKNYREEFNKYKNQVHPFLPLRKYKCENCPNIT